MRTYQSMHEVKAELRKKDLERQITKEQLKRNYHHFKKDFKANIIKNTAMTIVAKFGLTYLKQRFEQ